MKVTMMKSAWGPLLLAGFLHASDGRAAVSVLSGRTTGEGAVTLHPQLGWPGLSGELLFGAGPKLDAGFKLALLYGYEGVRLTNTIGVRMAGVLRFELLERDRLNLGLKLTPGLFFYSWLYGPAVYGLSVPIDLVLGILATPKLMLNVGLQLPFYVAFWPYAGAALPLLVGGGLEYFFTRTLGLTLNLRLGPSLPLAVPYDYPGAWPVCYYRGDPYYCGATIAGEFLLGLSAKL